MHQNKPYSLKVLLSEVFAAITKVAKVTTQGRIQSAAIQYSSSSLPPSRAMCLSPFQPVVGSTLLG